MKLTEEKIKKLIQTIAIDLTDAKLYLNYVNDLEECLIIKYPNSRQFANTFWTNTQTVYYSMMTICLMKAYDQSKDSTSLKLLLHRIQQNTDLFSAKAFKNRTPINSNFKRDTEEIFLSNLAKHIKYVTRTNELVKILVLIRNNNGFHRSEKVLYEEKSALDQIKIDQVKISHEDIEKLIDEGLSILNYYSNYFNADIYAGHMGGYGDHEEIFKILQKYYSEITQKANVP